MDPGQISIQKLNEAREMVTITKQRHIFLAETKRTLNAVVKFAWVVSIPNRYNYTDRIPCLDCEKVSAWKTTQLYFSGCTGAIFTEVFQERRRGRSDTSPNFKSLIVVINLLNSFRELYLLLEWLHPVKMKMRARHIWLNVQEKGRTETAVWRDPY